MSEPEMRTEGFDDIESILQHTGMFMPSQDRMQQISLEMRETEWRIMRRAAGTPTCISAVAHSGE